MPVLNFTPELGWRKVSVTGTIRLPHDMGRHLEKQLIMQATKWIEDMERTNRFRWANHLKLKGKRFALEMESRLKARRVSIAPGDRGGPATLPMPQSLDDSEGDYEWLFEAWFWKKETVTNYLVDRSRMLNAKKVDGMWQAAPAAGQEN